VRGFQTCFVSKRVHPRINLPGYIQEDSSGRMELSPKYGNGTSFHWMFQTWPAHMVWVMGWGL